MKGLFIPDITVEMFRNGCLEAIEALMAEGEIYDIEYDLKSAQPETANIIVGKSRDGMTMWYQCDNCNEPVDESDLYCRGCGRRLKNG